MTEAYIFEALRTPRGRGKRHGSLFEAKPIHLLKVLLQALAQRHALPTEEVDDCLIGCVTPTLDQGANIAKTALLYAGWSELVPGFQLNRFCASGLEAVNLAAMKVRSGWEHLVVAGGLESMSRVPMGSDGGPLLFDPEVSTKVHYIPQGVSADLIATLEGFSREDLDRYALLSQQRAATAWDEGRFARSLIPVRDDNGLLLLDHDEHMRPDSSLASLGSLPPAFAELGALGYDAVAQHRYPQVERVQHLHTAGNSSGIVDGAALLLIGSKEKGVALGLKPRARIVASATVGTEPTIMLQGPAPAARKALALANLRPEDIDLWEVNEAFAAPVLKFQRDMDVDIERINVNGGAIALGHPLGASGAIILGTLLDELERRDARTGVATLCVGGGMGVATVIERC